MMEAWIPLTLAAAFLQNIRSSLQVALKGRLSNTGATSVRFIYGLPPALVFLAAVAGLADAPVPSPSTRFLAYVVAGGSAQIFGTACLLHAATLRSFAVATAYSKTEPILAALFGLALLAEPVSAAASLGIAISVASVIGLGWVRGQGLPPAASDSRSAFAWVADPAAGFGIACGALFGLAAVSYRGAALVLDAPGLPSGTLSAALRSITTLCWVLGFQTLLMAGWLALREPAELRRVFAAWRPASAVGLAGAAASVGWFTAMTLQIAAYVRTLGQVELIFALGSSIFFFRERLRAGEFICIAGILAGLVLLIALR
jgi:drug/metabolite transporter (DMT)-like permease